MVLVDQGTFVDPSGIGHKSSSLLGIDGRLVGVENE